MAAYRIAIVSMLEHWGIDSLWCFTWSGQSRKKPHPLLARVLDQHNIMCVKRRIRQLITSEMIEIIMWFEDQASSSDHHGWSTSWPPPTVN
jgi:hypothetical protein